MADKVITSTGDCSSCCSGTPTECACALLLPMFSSPYASYTSAAAVLADADQVVDCYGYFFNSFGGSITSLSVDVSVANEVTWDTVRSSPSEFGQYLNVTLKSGDTLTLDFSGTMHSPASPSDVPSCSWVVYDCSGTQVHSDVTLDTASGTMTWSVSADGTYYVLIFWGACVGTPACGWSTGTAVVSSANLVTNPVIALWDDSGTTRQLEACPRLYLPVDRGSGIWYASLAVAKSEIARTVSNCVGIGPGRDFPGTRSFTATDGGSSLTLAVSLNNPCSGFTVGADAYGGLNLEAGDTLSVAWSSSVTGTTGVTSGYTLERLDESGLYVSVDSQSTFDAGTSDSGTFTYGITITGNYRVHISVSAPSSGTTTDTAAITAVFTSSGTLTVNPVRAQYDIGLDCPANWDCDGTETSDGSWSPGSGGCGGAA